MSDRLGSVANWWSLVFSDVWSNGFTVLLDGMFGGEMVFELGLGIAIVLTMAAYFLCARARPRRARVSRRTRPQLGFVRASTFRERGG